jgi:radical SAM superfamily enzyme
MEGVVGIAIATRVDCLSNEVLDLLASLNKETYLWVELGLQSVYDHHHELLNTGYKPKQFQEAVKNLAARGIDVVGHVILGLPHAPESLVVDTYNFLNALPLKGLKIHMLNVLKGTALEDIYAAAPL